MEIKLRKVGNSVAMIVPRQVREKMGVKEGDTVYLTETPDGYRVSPYDPEFEKQIESARKGMDAYRNTLRELAK